MLRTRSGNVISAAAVGALLLAFAMPTIAQDIPWIGGDGAKSYDNVANWTGGNIPDVGGGAGENAVIGDAAADRTITLGAGAKTNIRQLKWTQSTGGVTQTLVLNRDFEADIGVAITNGANPGDGSNMIVDANGNRMEYNMVAVSMTDLELRFEDTAGGGQHFSDNIGIGATSSVGPGTTMLSGNGAARSRGTWDPTAVIKGSTSRFDFDQILGAGLGNLVIGDSNFGFTQVCNIGEYNGAGNPARIQSNVTVNPNGRLQYFNHVDGGRNIVVGGDFVDVNTDGQNYEGADATLTFAKDPASARTVSIGRDLLVNMEVGYQAETGDIVLGQDLTTAGTFTVLNGSKVDVGLNVLSTGDLSFAGELAIALGSSGQVAVTGTAGLSGDLTLDTSGLASYTGPIILIDNDGADVLVGEFANAPNGTVYASPAGALELVYNYNGNDLALVSGTLTPIRTWAVDASGDWGVSGNWNPAEKPDGNTHTAVFGDTITADRTIFTDAAVTAMTIQFDNANSYAVAGQGSVNLEADSGNAAIDVVQGGHQFQAIVNLNSSTDVDVAASSSLAFNNALNLGGNTLTKTGNGTLEINNRLTTGGGSVIGLAGTITGSGKVGGSLTNTSATVAPGNSPGTLTVEGDFTQEAGGTLAIELAGTAAGEFDVLEVLGSAVLGGSLDITELYTPGGADTWTILTAFGGITGNFSTITPGYQVALANGDTELVLSLSGALLPGDANGDGCVDDLDLTALAVHWQRSTNLWEEGDFNGDGIVDDLDLTALAVNWQQGCGGGGSFADALAAANVPEPGSAGLMLLVSIGFLRRRKA